MNSKPIGGSQSRLLIFCWSAFISSGLVFSPLCAQEVETQSTLTQSTPAAVFATISPQRIPATETSREIELPSELPSGDATNDTIHFEWYPATQSTLLPKPAVLLLHPLGRQNQKPMHDYARYLRERGISSAVITLPYHGRRLRGGDRTPYHFLNPETDIVVRTFKQSVSDASTVLTWMSTQPGVDSERLGAVGISVGAIILHLLMAEDERVKAGVAALGGGALAESYRSNPLAQSKFLFRVFSGSPKYRKLKPEDLERLDEIDPATKAFASKNQPRRVLMIEAARDIVIQPQSAEQLWRALEKPPIKWVDANHFAAIDMARRSTMRAAAVYLQSVWNGQTPTARDIPDVRAPTLKAGVVMNLDSIVTPAVQWQFLGVGKHEHRTLVGANLGMSGRGPFLGVAVNVKSYFDVGVAKRWNGNRIKPYASLHFVY